MACKKSRIAVLLDNRLCSLAVCEDGHSEEEDPVWDPVPSRNARCLGVCEDHEGRCGRRQAHQGPCQCRRCFIKSVAAILLKSAGEVLYEEMMTLAPVVYGSDDLPWQPAGKIHYDYYTGEPLDEEKYQAGKQDELEAMQQYEVYEEIPNSEAVGGKHVGGFPIAHNKGPIVRWRFVATEINYEARQDNQQGTPPLMIVRAIVSRAASRPSGGVHRRLVRSWVVRKAFFHAGLDDILEVNHPIDLTILSNNQRGSPLPSHLL